MFETPNEEWEINSDGSNYDNYDWGNNVIREFENELEKIYSIAANCKDECSISNTRFSPIFGI